jgi:hypothetical protein
MASRRAARDQAGRILIQIKRAGFPCEMLVALAERMTSFNPDQSWQAVTDIEPLR